MTGPKCRPTLLEADLHSTQEKLREFAAYGIPVDEGQGTTSKSQKKDQVSGKHTEQDYPEK